MNCLYLKIAKVVLKRQTRAQRALRLCFIGKRLQVKQYRWLHYNEHPWEFEKPSEDRN